jgi:hypothetical protein
MLILRYSYGLQEKVKYHISCNWVLLQYEILHSNKYLKLLPPAAKTWGNTCVPRQLDEVELVDIERVQEVPPVLVLAVIVLDSDIESIDSIEAIAVPVGVGVGDIGLLAVEGNRGDGSIIGVIVGFIHTCKGGGR